MADNLPPLVVEGFLALMLEDLEAQRMCAPKQQRLRDVPTVPFDIRFPDGDQDNLVDRYEYLLAQIMHRLRKIAPGTYAGKPITPYPNPHNNRTNPSESHSYFRIEMFSGDDESVRVQFLIRDFDLYLLGFRRSKEGGRWSPWYRFKSDRASRLGWPAFDMGQVVTFNFDGGHEKKAPIGGRITLQIILDALGKCNGESDEVNAALQHAMVFFCEALRFRYVLDAMVRRITNGENASELNEDGVPAWKRITSWGYLCAIVLDTGLNGGVVPIENRGKLLFAREHYGINSFEELTAELRVLKRIEKSHLIPRRRSENNFATYAWDVSEPGFRPPDQAYDQDTNQPLQYY